MAAPLRLRALSPRFLLAALSGMAVACVHAQTLITTWSGTGDWSDPTHWSQGVAGIGHVAQIPSGEAIVSDSRSVGAVALFGGTISGAGTLTLVNTGSVWSSGSLRGTGRLVVSPTATLDLTGADPKVFSRADGNGFGGRIIDNSGTITVTGAGSLLGGDGAQFLNQAGGVLDLKNDIAIGYSGNGNLPSFTNAGLIRKSAGTGPVTISSFAFVTSGTVEVTAGAINFTTGVTSNGGSFVAGPGTSLVFTGGQTFNANTSFTGAGVIRLAGGTSILNGNLTSENVTFESGSLQGTAVVSGNLKWTGGDWHGTGTYTVPLGSALEISGAAPKTFARGDGNGFGGRKIENLGSITWTGTGSLFGGDGAQIVNRGSGTFLVNNDVTLGYSGSGEWPAFTNEGTFRKAGSAGTTTINRIGFSNTGLVDVTSGNLAFAGGVTSTSGTIRAAAGTTISFAGGQSFSGTTFDAIGGISIVGGDTTVGGTIAAGGLQFAGGSLLGSATIDGSLTWTGGTWRSSSTLAFIAGSTLTLSGTADKTISRGDGNGFGGRVVQSAGAIRWTDAGRILGNDAAGIGISTGGLLEIRNDSMYTYGGSGEIPFLSNAGTVRKLASNGATTFSSVAFTNTGRLEIQSGTLQLTGSGGLANNGVVEVQAGTLVSGATGATSTGGTFTVFANAGLQYTGGTNTIVDSSFAGAGLTEVNGGTLLVSGVNLTGRLQLGSGAIGGAGALTVGAGGAFTWSGGNLSGTGTLTIGAGGGMSIEGAADKRFYRGDGNGFGGRIISNYGTITWSGSGHLLGGDGAQILNQAAGIFEITGDANFGYTGSGNAPTFSNAGMLRKSSGTGITEFTCPLANAGVLESKTGTVRISGGGSGGGQFVAAGGVIDFAGSYTLNDGAKILGNTLARITAGTLTVPSAAAATVGTPAERGWLALESGTFSGAGLLLIDALGEMDWTGGVLQGTGTLRIAVGGRLDVAGLINHDFSRADGNGFGGLTIENFGTLAWSGGNLRGGDGARIQNRAGALFDIQTAGTVGYTGSGNWPTFLNEGTLRKATGTTVFSGMTLTNTGTIEVASGVLQFDSAVTNNGGTFLAQPGASIVFAGGQTFSSGSVLGGSGLARATAGDTTLSGNLALQNFEFAGGRLLGTAAITSGVMTWTGGDLYGANTLTIESGASLILSGTGNRAFARGDGNGFGGRVIENKGAMIIANVGDLLGSDGASLVNRSTGVIELRNNGSFAYGGSGNPPSFTNEGLLVKSTGTGTSTVAVPFTSTGTITVATGTLALTSTFANTNGNIAVANNSTFTAPGALNIGTGFLEGWGTINAPEGVAVGLATGTPGVGGFVMPGNLVINGNLTLAATSLLSFALAGPTQGNTDGTGYGFVNVNGALTLGGALVFDFENSFWAQVTPAQQFVVAQASSLSGAFANVAPGQRLFSTDGAGSFAVNYGAGSLLGQTRVVLSDFQPVPEPSTWALLGMGAAVFMILARRRSGREGV